MSVEKITDFDIYRWREGLICLDVYKRQAYDWVCAPLVCYSFIDGSRCRYIGGEAFGKEAEKSC